MNSVSVKENILHTFQRMSFERGLKQTSLDDVAKELKISKKTIYRYYSSKEELVALLVDSMIRDVVAVSEKYMSGEGSPVEKCIHTFSYVGETLKGINQNFMAELQEQYPKLWEKVHEIRSKRLSMFLSIIQDGVNDGSFRKIHPAVAVQMIVSSISAVLDPAFLSAHSLKTEEAVQDLKGILLDGMRTPSEK